MSPYLEGLSLRLDYSNSILSFIAEHSENKANESSRVGKVGSGSEVRLMGAEGIGVVSEGSVGGSEVGRFIEGAKGGAERDDVGSKVSGTYKVYS